MMLLQKELASAPLLVLHHFNKRLPLSLHLRLHPNWLAYIPMVTSDENREGRTLPFQTHVELLRNYCVQVLRSDAERLQRAVEEYATNVLERRTGSAA